MIINGIFVSGNPLYPFDCRAVTLSDMNGCQLSPYGEEGYGWNMMCTPAYSMFSICPVETPATKETCLKLYNDVYVPLLSLRLDSPDPFGYFAISRCDIPNHDQP